MTNLKYSINFSWGICKINNKFKLNTGLISASPSTSSGQVVYTNNFYKLRNLRGKYQQLSKAVFRRCNVLTTEDLSRIFQSCTSKCVIIVMYTVANQWSCISDGFLSYNLKKITLNLQYIELLFLIHRSNIQKFLRTRYPQELH